MIETVYKIVVRYENNIYTIFHGIEGRKRLPYDKWLRAEHKMVRDGSGGKEYLSGIHCFKSFDTALTYMGKFRNRDDLDVIECAAIDLKQKPTNPDVWLADAIYIPSQK